MLVLRIVVTVVLGLLLSGAIGVLAASCMEPPTDPNNRPERAEWIAGRIIALLLAAALTACIVFVWIV